jgi:chromate reductase
MSSGETIKVLGIAGSLRERSFNRMALRAAQALAPEGISVESLDIAGVPLYNDDVRAQGYPPKVQALREAIAAADALLIATPEYNFSIPGVLKNAIDWASRPPDQPFAGKPVAIMGASPGRVGTARAQYHLRQMLVFLDAHALNKPEVLIGGAGQVFDEAGNLTDEATQGFVRDLLTALAVWTRRLKAA